MRIAVGSIMHESNTFTHHTTPLESFSPLLGDEVYKDTEWMQDTAAGGIIQTLRDEGCTVVPTLFGDALPSGVVQAAAYEYMRDQMLERIAAEKNLDGICLALHGSMFVEGLDDPEGDLLVRLRAIVGPDLPIVCALDMHATVTEPMIRSIDGLTAYKTAPHTDKYETGERAARLLLDSLRRNVSLVCYWERLPILLSGEQSETDAEPMLSLLSALEQVEHTPGIGAASYLLGFPWADSPHGSAAAVVVGEERVQDLVRDKTIELAQKFWDRRFDFHFTTEAHPLDQAIDLAMNETRRPIVIADSGDNPTAGASGELSIVLEQLLAKECRDVLFAVIVDPDAISRVVQAGEGADVELELGRLAPGANSPKLPVKAHVRRIAVAFEVRSAVLEIDGVVAIVTESRMDVTDPNYLLQLGLDPQSFQTIIVKSGYLSPAYQKLAARKILALTPGDSNVVLSELPYRRVLRPIFPLDKDVHWAPK